MTRRTVAAAIRAALLTAEPRAKVMAARAAARDWRLGWLDFAFDLAMPDRPARPARPELLPPNRMPKRGRGGSDKGRIALWHALAHIEFSAIDLALDAAGRFGGELGEGFVGDFLAVAADEAMHFALLDRRLRALARKIHRIAHWATGFRFLVGGRRVGSYPVMSRSLRMWRLAG